MKKHLLLLCGVVSLLSSVAHAHNQTDTRAQREASATAVDTLAAVLGSADRGLFEDAYEKIESTLDPKTYNALLGLEQKALALEAKRDALLKTGEFDEYSEQVKQLNEQIEALEVELKILMRNGGALHWRSMLAVGIASSLSVLAYRLSSGWYSKPKRAILTFITVSVVLEFMLRGRHAILAGWTYRGARELFGLIRKGIEKLLGRAGAGDKFMIMLEEQFGGPSKQLDELLSGAKGPIVAAVITVACLGTVLWATSGSGSKKKQKKKERAPTPAKG